MDLEKTDVSVENYTDRWEKRWAEDGGVPPGAFWDAKAPSPALVDALESRVGCQGKRALVPGCGRGYDCVAFAKAGAAEVVGLELSPTAVGVADEYLKSQLGDRASKARVESGDFFEWEDPSGGFDIGYDYTFFCAMHPEMRQDWAAAWHRHLKPGGTLITLVFPPPNLMKPLGEGPPFAVTPELYEKYLLSSGFERVDVAPVPEQLSHEGRKGHEFLGLWKRA